MVCSTILEQSVVLVGDQLEQQLGAQQPPRVLRLVQLGHAQVRLVESVNEISR